MRADPHLTAHTAGIMVDGAATLAGLGPQLISTMDVSPDAFGSLARSVELNNAYGSSAAALESLVGVLGQLLEGDADRLYQQAFAYQAVESSAARHLGGAGMRAAASTPSITGGSGVHR